MNQYKKLLSFLKNDLIFYDVKLYSKDEALTFLADKMMQNGYGYSAQKILEQFQDREEISSTGVGQEIAIPHLRSNVMSKSVISFIRLNQPLNWDAIDEQNVKYIFAIALNNKDGNNDHLEMIALLSNLLLDDKFIKQLPLLKTSEDLINLIQSFDKDNQPKTNLIKQETILETKKLEQTNKNFEKKHYDVVAVTACPTGIAHTFYAQKALEKTANEMGLKIKVETQGTDGVKNNLSHDDIVNAKAVILACDRTIETMRFKDHNNVLEISAKNAIVNAKKFLQEAMNQKGKKLQNVTGTSENSAAKFDNGELSFNGFFKKAYKSILTGVSYMLPFVVFGGIMIAIGFIIDIPHLTSENAGNYGAITNASFWFNKIGAISFSLIVPILAGYITYTIVGKMGLLPGFVVGFMSTNSEIYGPRTFVNLSGDLLGGAQSGFFGGILGAFLASAILIVLIKYSLNWFPKNLNGIKNILVIPFFGTLIIAGLFYFINIPLIYVNVGFAYILNKMNEQPALAILLGMIVGGMMCVDLGGPINKAAYFFGVSTLTSGNGSLTMAAVMIAGMIPPLGIAASTLIHKKLWTQEERISAYSNWVFGLSFISEGAIPFTATKPKILVPSNIIAGIVAGLMSSALGITLAAPHGGIFVVALFSTNLSSLENLTVDLKLGIGIAFFLMTLIVATFTEVLMIWLFSHLEKDKKLTAWIDLLNQSKFLKKIKNLTKIKAKFHLLENMKIPYQAFLEQKEFLKKINYK